MKYIDKNLNIKKPAMEILRLLANKQVKTRHGAAVSTDTAAWYNGRERGISLVCRDYDNRESLVVVWTECRNSDSIIVYMWRATALSFMNPPQFSDASFTDAVYRAGRSFRYDEQKKAAAHIHALVRAYFA